jgi:serine protease Do
MPRGRLGAFIQDVTVDLAQSFGLDKATGALIARVQPGSPAAKVGLQPGDIVLRYNGEAIEDANELSRLVAATKPGTQAKLEVWRERSSREVGVMIGELRSDNLARSAPAAAPKANRLGLGVRILPPEQRKALGVAFGLVVETIDPAARAPQLNPGDVIVGLNNTEFESLEHFNEIVAKQKPGTSVALLVRRGDATLYIPVKVQG